MHLNAYKKLHHHKCLFIRDNLSINFTECKMSELVTISTWFSLTFFLKTSNWRHFVRILSNITHSVVVETV